MHFKNSLWHVLFWVTIVALGIATIYPYYLDLKIATLDRLVFLPVWWIATYTNWWLLIPKLLGQRKILLFIISNVVLLFLLTTAQRYLCLFWFYPSFLWTSHTDPALLQPFLFNKFIQFAAFIALPILCAIIIYYLMKWYQESFKARQILAQQQTAELNYLKAQIKPHFLFNTLNNLYGLSMEESKKVPDMILKLSDILSYSLYESNVESVELAKEVKLIKDFISLEEERYQERISVTFKYDDHLLDEVVIAPLLLIPLVENAFKHGVKEAIEEIPVDIELMIRNGTLSFSVVNKVPVVLDEQGDQHHGLGLKNLRRRLNLLYPNKHSFIAEKNGDTFVANLKIQIDG